MLVGRYDRSESCYDTSVNTIAEIGKNDPTIQYSDRPTVKVILQKGTDILILNDGLLPGGGVDDGEADIQAIFRELEEELGVTVTNSKAIGTIIQYRDFLEKRYVIKGFTADFVAFDKNIHPQDSGEAQFSYRWLQKGVALKLIEDSINSYDTLAIRDDFLQGKLFNLKTSRELLLALQ